MLFLICIKVRSLLVGHVQCGMESVCEVGAVAPVSAVRPAKRMNLVSHKLESKRLVREWKTILAMMKIYCHDEHGVARGLCQECQELFEYARVRLERCRFGAEKPTCANCPVHCYLPKRREQVKVIMRYAGPKMLWKHPILAIRHLLDGRREAPPVN